MAEPTDWERTARELAQVCEAQEEEVERLRRQAEASDTGEAHQTRVANAALTRVAELEAECERLRADAALGAMVRRLPEAYSLEHAAAHMPEAWAVRDWADTAVAVCDTPDAALRAAGLGEEEQP